MKRREFIGLLGGTVIGWPTCSRADWMGRVWRVGIVRASGTEHLERELERRLGDLGYVRGKNFVLIDQLSEPSPEAFENAIASLISNIDLLVVVGTIGGVAAKKVVATTPVIFISVGAPVEIGLVESLARPGGNMTGITFEAATETYAKRLQILKEIMPKLNRVACKRTVIRTSNSRWLLWKELRRILELDCYPSALALPMIFLTDSMKWSGAKPRR
jgi:putative tryptophan/tyrosine transport system substrate-binding protein